MSYIGSHIATRRVTMRFALTFVLLASACVSPSSSDTETFVSVRDHLETKPVRLYVGSEGSDGLISARRWTSGGWIAGDTPLTIVSGELKASADDAGRLTLTTFEVGVDSIDIPEEVFKKPAQLTDVTLKLTASASGDTTWTSDDAATVTVNANLDFSWTIKIDGNKTPLGTQHLPPVPVDVMLSGDGNAVAASIGVHASGELWDWAGLLQMTALELSLSAEETN
jgi:hypothetical protein